MRVLLAWELGANYGHIAPLRALAVALRALGQDCVFALRDLSVAEGFLEPTLGAVLQAPVQMEPTPNPVKTQLNFASLLHNSGYASEDGLTARLRAWRALMQERGIGRVVVAHAPSALIAAQLLGLPAMNLGSGFTVPPVVQPFPSFRPDLRFDPAVLARNEAAVLHTLNRALARLGARSFDSLQQIFRAADNRVLSFAETDHYDIPRPEPHLGVPDQSSGEAPEWPQFQGPRILAYLRPFAQLEMLLAALKASRACVLLRIGGYPAASLAQYLRPGMALIDRPLNLAAAAPGCDAFIGYGSHGAAVELLLAGKPLLLFPTNVERQLVARRALQLGAALVPAGKAEPDFAGLIERLCTDPQLAAAAQGFAARNAALDRKAIIPALVQRLSL